MSLTRLAALLVCATALHAQAIFGSIQGTVVDQSDSIIPAVKVNVRNVETGLVFAATSNDSGLYLLGQIPPGAYDLTAEKSGFVTVVQRGIVVRVNDALRVDLRLPVGQVQQQVTVTGAAPLVQTEDNAIGKVVEERTIKELPLAGRNAFSLILLAPGAQQGSVSNGTGSDSQPRLSGGRARTNEFTIDGTSSTDPRRGDTVYSPNLDALQEFSVQTEGIPAEYGRLVGGIVNATLKSGTNEFHGNVFEFNRNAAFDARNFFAASVPAHVYNQFGGIFGGPIIHNKTFFFVDYQGTRNRQQSVFNITVPTAQDLQGNFSRSLGAQVATDALGRPVNSNEIFDPATTSSAPNGQSVRDPFPGNLIPTSRFDPVALKVLSLYPLANRTGTLNFGDLSSGGLNEDQFDVRADHRFSDRDFFFLRLSDDLQDNLTARPYSYSTTGGSQRQENTYFTGAVDWTRAFSPTFTNDLRSGAFRGELQRFFANTQSILGSIPNLLTGLSLPQFKISGYDTIGDSVPLDPTEEEYQVQDIVSLVRGHHIIKFGGDYRKFRINDLQLNATALTFSKNQTASFASGSTGNVIASLLLGMADSYTTDPNRGRFYERSNYLGAFIQDEFRVNADLTLNIGLRYDVEQQPNETRWHGSNFDLTSGQVLTMQQLGTNRIQATDWNNFGPRVGFAWRAFGSKTVVRSSYGIFYIPLTGRATSAFNRFPQSQQVTLQSSALAPAVIISNLPPVVRNTTGYGQNQYHDEVNAPVGYFEQWNFDIQRELPGDLLVQATYVGSTGKHLLANTQYNEIPIGVVQAAGSGTQAMRPYPNFANVGYFCECQSSTYHALELSAEKRYKHGLTFLASYTWSKFLDEQDDNFSSLYPETSYNRRLEKGPSLANIPWRFVFSGVYDLPFGAKRTYLKSGVLSQIVGGWQLGAILSLQSGQEVWITQANNTAQTFSQQFRPNLVSDPILPSDQQTLTHWFNTAAFTAPAPLTIGNSSKTPNILGPGWANLDFNIHRSLHIPWRESTNLEVRGECFNCANRANFLPPVGQFGTTTFGQITAAQPARVLQVAMKFWF